MKHTTEIKIEKLEKCPVFDEYFGNLKIGAMDIETTGLSPERSRFILGGLVTLDSFEEIPDDPAHINARLICEEFFNEYNTPADEKAALEAYLAALNKLDLMFSYNGAHFDVPFLSTRFKKHGIDFETSLPFNLDLYQVVSRFSDLRKVLPNLKQKTVETFMGLWPTRTDAISGSDSIDLYYAYLSHKPGEGRDAIKATIILHNSDDCMQLMRLLPVIKKCDFHRALFELGAPAGHLHLTGSCLKRGGSRNSGLGGSLIVHGLQADEPRDFRSFAGPDQPFDLEMKKSTREFTLTLPLEIIPASPGVPELTILDTAPLNLDCSEIEGLPGFENQYIIVAKDKEINFRIINHFLRLICYK